MTRLESGSRPGIENTSSSRPNGTGSGSNPASTRRLGRLPWRDLALILTCCVLIVISAVFSQARISSSSFQANRQNDEILRSIGAIREYVIDRDATWQSMLEEIRDHARREEARPPKPWTPWPGLSP